MSTPRVVATRKRSGSWLAFRAVMLVTAASLAIYIPYKYATQLHAIDGLYAVLFPLSSVLAIAGVALGVRPALAFRLPTPARAAVGAIAGSWLMTGVLCIPSLTETTLEAPAAGLFATFHMLAQHVVLSLAVSALVLAPRATYARFGVEPPAPRARSADAWAPSGA